MVATENEEIFRIFDLVRQEKTNGLERLLASIYVVAEEEVVCFWWETAVFEQPKKVIVLTVYITADLNTIQVSWCTKISRLEKLYSALLTRHSTYLYRRFQLQQYGL